MNLRTMTSSQTTEVDESRVAEFEEQFRGRLIRPRDAQYDEARSIWNGMIDKFPALIARCSDATDVAAAVRFARRHELLVSVRGGGHNVAGTAVCDGGLVIDLSPMRKVTVEPDAQVAHAEGGATIRELDQATQKYDLAVPMGVVSETGIAGLTLGGGIGWLRNKYGLSCDSLTGAEVVTANGDIIWANRDQNADLLWGLRGGGGNFGIVTTFEYDLHSVGPQVMFAFVFHDGAKIRQILEFYRTFCADAPDEISSFAICGDIPAEEPFPEAIHGRPYVLLAACYAGDIEKGRRALQPMRNVAEPLIDLSGPMSYSEEVQTILDEDYPDGLRYYWKSLYMNELSDAAIERIIDHNRKRVSPIATLDIWHMGGAIHRIPGGETAFANRDAAFLLGVEANWVDADRDEANISWTRDCIQDMQRFSDGSQYLNFPGFHEEDTGLRATYGENYERLVSLKSKFDPDNFFRLNSNIQPRK